MKEFDFYVNHIKRQCIVWNVDAKYIYTCIHSMKKNKWIIHTKQCHQKCTGSSLAGVNSSNKLVKKYHE